ncbi:MAG TPA: hypothetical protein VM870_11485 [Pyrinomonadaceae bacterium]|nr:hypothetical protein [Pyrinomonadaceae bacterium]
MNRLLVALLVAILTLAATPSGAAQKKKLRAKQAVEKNEPPKPATPAEQSRRELIEATRRYKTSLQELIGYHERAAERAAEKRDKLKTLYAQGIVSRRELEEAEGEVEAARAKVAETRSSMAGADTVIAQTLEESRLAEQLAKAPKLPPGSLLKTVAYIRYQGPANWSLADAHTVQGFFLARFNRSLPVSAFGQTAVHNQLGFDHRNALDAAVHPDSPEGASLMDYLRRAGIPFIAFRQAVSGTATGPHIHIGRPSRRLAN